MRSSREFVQDSSTTAVCSFQAAPQLPGVIMMRSYSGCCVILLAWFWAYSGVIVYGKPLQKNSGGTAEAAAVAPGWPTQASIRSLRGEKVMGAPSTGGGSSSNSNRRSTKDSGNDYTSAWARRRVAYVARDSSQKGAGWAGEAVRGEVFSLLDRSTRQPWERWKAKHGGIFAQEGINRKEQAAARTTGMRPEYKLTFWGCMVAGAVSRSVAQTALHPANVVKTMLQAKGSVRAMLPLTWSTLSRGAGAQFLLSLPNGALHFAVLEKTRTMMAELLPVRSASFLLDFASSSTATALCSVMSTPQMVLTNRIMAGVYPNLLNGVRSVMKQEGVRGFYVGWWPGLVQKVPSYGLTWVLFQQVKDLHYRVAKRLPTNAENFWLGSTAAAGSVTIMIPMDTVKTRLVTQATSPQAYAGILNCFSRMLREEGLGSFYNSLTPRLVSVVPMIGVQYFVYEFLKKAMAEVPESTPLAPTKPAPARGEPVADLDAVTEV